MESNNDMSDKIMSPHKSVTCILKDLEIWYATFFQAIRCTFSPAKYHIKSPTVLRA